MSGSSSSQSSGGSGSNDPLFLTTRWTSVLSARGDSPEAKAALSELCALYWTPVFRFLRYEGRDEETARELTQEFFAKVLARDTLAHVDPELGRFRSFLLGALKHFLRDYRDREKAAKRGGAWKHQSLSEPKSTDARDSSPAHAETDLDIPDPSATVPDPYFDRQWAFVVIEHALERLAQEMVEAGKLEQFETLKPWLVGEVDVETQLAATRRLEMTEGALKVAIHRLRKRFGAQVRLEIAQTVSDPSQAETELKYLLDVLSSN